MAGFRAGEHDAVLRCAARRGPGGERVVGDVELDRVVGDVVRVDVAGADLVGVDAEVAVAVDGVAADDELRRGGAGVVEPADAARAAVQAVADQLAATTRGDARAAADAHEDVGQLGVADDRAGALEVDAVLAVRERGVVAAVMDVDALVGRLAGPVEDARVAGVRELRVAVDPAGRLVVRVVDDDALADRREDAGVRDRHVLDARARAADPDAVRVVVRVQVVKRDVRAVDQVGGLVRVVADLEATEGHEPRGVVDLDAREPAGRAVEHRAAGAVRAEHDGRGGGADGVRAEHPRVGRAAPEQHRVAGDEAHAVHAADRLPGGRLRRAGQRVGSGGTVDVVRRGLGGAGGHGESGGGEGDDAGESVSHEEGRTFSLLIGALSSPHLTPPGTPPSPRRGKRSPARGSSPPDGPGGRRYGGCSTPREGEKRRQLRRKRRPIAAACSRISNRRSTSSDRTGTRSRRASATMLATPNAMPARLEASAAPVEP